MLITPAVTALPETESIEVAKTKDTKGQEEVQVTPPTELGKTEEPKTDDAAAAEEPKAVEAEAPAALDETKELVAEEKPEAVVAVENAVEEVVKETKGRTTDLAAAEEASPEEKKAVEEASTETTVGKTE